MSIAIKDLDKLSPRAEDYLKCIYMLEETHGKVRIKDIAELMGVKPSSVIDYLRRLSQEGYIVYEPGKKIVLTEKGKNIAKQIYKTYETVKEFLILLGVPEDIAKIDACRIEHGLHEITLRKITEFIEKHRQNIGKKA